MGQREVVAMSLAIHEEPVVDGVEELLVEEVSIDGLCGVY
ncbi:MAG: mycofactocin precursor MftA [Acidimicrobiales bacterium]